ncbi:MAG: hypothetical protein RLZZ510_1063, partial [Bacteroidota bacterium]
CSFKYSFWCNHRDITGYYFIWAESGVSGFFCRLFRDIIRILYLKSKEIFVLVALQSLDIILDDANFPGQAAAVETSKVSCAYIVAVIRQILTCQWHV